MSQSPHQSHRRRRRLGRSALLAAALAGPVGLVACGSSSAPGVSSLGAVQVVAAENEYGNVAAQIGGRYVQRLVGGEQPEHRPAHLRGEPERGGRGRPEPAS